MDDSLEANDPEEQEKVEMAEELVENAKDLLFGK